MSTYARVLVNGKKALTKLIVIGETPKITNLDIPISDTEYQHVVTDGTTQIMIKSRNIARLKFAYTSGESAINYVTIEPGTTYSLGNIYLEGVTIYIQSSHTTTLEITEFYVPATA